MDIFGRNVNIVYFEKATIDVNKAQEKVARMRFSVLLTEETSKQSPHQIESAFNLISQLDNGATSVKLEELVVKNVNIEFFDLPEAMRVTMQFTDIVLAGITVNRSEEGLNHVFCTFVIEVKLENRSDLKVWVVDNCCNQIYARFDNAQPSLLQDAMNEMAEGAAPATATDDQPPLPGVPAPAAPKKAAKKKSAKKKGGKAAAAGEDADGDLEGQDPPEPPATDVVQ